MIILAVDVDYKGGGASTGGVLFSHWEDPQPLRDVVVKSSRVEEYVPGQFYRRELPCILALLESLPEQPDYIVVDGYVFLGAEEKPGLGHYLYKSLDERIPVIGTAKSRFKETPEKYALLRGSSNRPLYVTSIGIDYEEAKAHIASMAGEDRHPVLLKRADQLCRGLIQPSVGQQE